MKITDEMTELARKAADEINGGASAYFVILGAFEALSASPAGVVETAMQAAMIGSYANDAAHNLLVTHTGQEGGCPRIDWYKLRGEIAYVIEAAIDDFSAHPAAQADYSARIMSAIEPAGVGVETAPPSSHVAGDQHPDDLAVDRFAAAMKAKLAKKRDEGRGGWDDKEHCSNAFLSDLLLEHVAKGDPVDVGNLAMMVHQRGESICVLTERVAAVSQLHAIVDAWEALPGGRQVKNSDVERWLAKDMGPGIDAIRGFLRRPRPDGVLPPPPETREAGE